MEKILELQIRKQASRIENEIIARIEEIISHVSESTPLETPIDQWTLSFLLKVSEGKIIGQVITHEAVELATFDIGSMFIDIFTNQMTGPEQFKQDIINNLGGGNLEELAKTKLGANYILVKYNQNFELETYHISKDSSTKVSISHFIRTADL